MGLGRFIHHFGAFLLFAATVLLVVVDITAPVVNDISLLKVDLGNSADGSAVTFGTFGYCVLDVNGRDDCSKVRIGYNPAQVITAVDGTEFSNASENTSKALTRVMVLHPVATGLCFIAFILCLGAGTLGSFVASLVSALACLVTVVVLACDFVAFGIIKRKVNDSSTGSSASWSAGIWLVLVSAILALAATVVVFFTCCAGRSRRRRESGKMGTIHE
ncbi:actin cortical patch SUR7/pH-response regulator pali [Ilyonectria sp. MPI-CAGE-AT-0026]|nr:actin cortical patch SUR7/pH-response regulator pali [Ilyonectria sp. MPI-CAGE-AT-0026]